MQPWFEPSTSSPAAILGKSRKTSSFIFATVSSFGDLMSRLNDTSPGTVFVEPGLRLSIPVDANAELAVARRWECNIILLAVSRASARDLRSVVPVCESRPLTLTVIHL